LGMHAFVFEDDRQRPAAAHSRTSADIAFTSVTALPALLLICYSPPAIMLLCCAGGCCQLAGCGICCGCFARGEPTNFVRAAAF
jgi:hypothetical protein